MAVVVLPLDVIGMLLKQPAGLTPELPGWKLLDKLKHRSAG